MNRILQKMAAVAALTVLSIQTLLAQGSISGVVTDAATGEPVLGATILLAGTTRGTASGADGTFLLNNVTAGTHTVEADSRPDSASCRLDGEEIGRNRPGVNITVVDRETGERVQSISFSTLHDYAAYTA